MVGVDKDLAAHFMIINNRGRCLFGTPILKLFGEVEDKYYFDIIVNDIVNAREEISYNTMYLILNLIRVLVYKIDKSIYSKLEEGEWGPVEVRISSLRFRGGPSRVRNFG